MAVVKRRIDAPADRVFAVLADGWVYSGWVVGASHMRAVGADWPAVGSRLFHASGTWPATVNDQTAVEAVEQDRRLVLLARGGFMGAARIEMTLRPDPGGGTVVVMDERPVDGPGRWAHNPALDRVLAWRNRESLSRLAVLAERPSTPTKE
jgi:uncharacterized protein YndB with AHSA1/START domain